MTYEEFRDRLISISHDKICLHFLADRIRDNNYRGIQLSQHNRYNMDTIIIMLRELYNLVGESKMAIRTTDLKKRPYNTPDEYTYATYVNNLSNRLDRCTQDSVRKNLFVDLHRMNLIERFDKNENRLSPYANGTKKYVKISPLGIALIEASTLFERKLKYTRAINTLTKGLAEELLDVSSLDGKITETEFQFFFSYIGEELNGHLYTKTELLDFIREFRSLSKYQKQGVISIVEQYCNPNTFVGDKTQKRDFHNWLNETQQIFMLMSQTAFFEVSSGILSIRVGKDSVYDNKEKYIRSKNEKEKYFKNHSLNRRSGFELHHVVPLCWANNALEFSALDVWQNLVYIDGFSHAQISQNNNKNVKMVFNENDICFSDFENNGVYCKEGENVLYDVDKKTIMSSYNKDLLESIL